jgi:lipopolysaccharide export system permease protein
MQFRLKRLDYLLLKSFLGPFAITSVLVIFTFIMQFYWLYMDDLIGKGLGVGMMLQLLLYMIPSIVPLALPLIVMLASIMTLGNLGEHFELVAIKSSGISLFRFIRPVSVFIVLLAIGAYFFNNNVLPVANLKSYSLLYDMRNQQPTSSFNEGVFNNEFKGYSIRIDKKDKDGKGIYGVLIYDHTAGDGNKNVVVAEKGSMYPSAGGKYLVFELENGWRHEEKKNGTEDELTRMYFKKWYLTFDMSQFDFERTSEEEFKSREDMMNLQQLTSYVDSFNGKLEQGKENIILNVYSYVSMLKPGLSDTVLVPKLTADANLDHLNYNSSFQELLPDSSKILFWKVRVMLLVIFSAR